MRRLVTVLAFLAVAGALGFASGGTESTAAAPKQETVFLNIGTGGTSGTYYPLGGAMAEIISKNVPGVNATAVATAATVANLNKLGEKEFQMVMVQNDVTYYAYSGTEMFKDKKMASLRGIASLYYETIQIVTLASTGIKSFDDLKGKRIAVGAAGSGTEINTRQILELVGLTYNDIRPQYLSFAEAANGLRDGNTDAALVTAGIPTAAIRDVAAQKDVVLVPVPESLATKIIAKYPFYTRYVVPKDTYPKQAADVPTLAVKAILVVDASMSDQVAYNVTKAIFTNLDRLALAHAQGKVIKKETALEGLPVPVHPGAEKFFKGQ
jgi:TRAP transporter TAXI family solute receptor